MSSLPLIPHGCLVACQCKLCSTLWPHGDDGTIAYFHSLAFPNSGFHYNLDAYNYFHPHAYPFSDANDYARTLTDANGYAYVLTDANDYAYVLADAKSFSHLHSDGSPHACGRKGLPLTHEP